MTSVMLANALKPISTVEVAIPRATPTKSDSTSPQSTKRNKATFLSSRETTNTLLDGVPVTVSWYFTAKVSAASGAARFLKKAVSSG